MLSNWIKYIGGLFWLVLNSSLVAIGVYRRLVLTFYLIYGVLFHPPYPAYHGVTPENWQAHFGAWKHSRYLVRKYRYAVSPNEVSLT